MAFECSLLIISFLSSPKTVSGPSLDILVFCEYFQANLFFFFFILWSSLQAKTEKHWLMNIISLHISKKY